MRSSTALLALCLAFYPLTAGAREATSGPQLFGMAAEVDRAAESAAEYRKQGEYAKAEAILAEFPAGGSEQLDEYSRLALAGANFNLGMTYLRNRQYEKAVKFFEIADRFDSTSAMGAYFLGTAYRKAKHYDKAVVTLKRAIGLSPDFPSAHFSLGNAYFVLGEYSQAKRAYEKAVALNPLHIPAHYMLGSVAWRQGRIEDAVASWEQVLEIDPDHEKARSRLARAKGYAEISVYPILPEPSRLSSGGSEQTNRLAC